MLLSFFFRYTAVRNEERYGRFISANRAIKYMQRHGWVRETHQGVPYARLFFMKVTGGRILTAEVIEIRPALFKPFRLLEAS